MMDRLAAALRLHRYALAQHWDGRALIGPDPGVRFNYRIGRFVKSYLPMARWHDTLSYVQGQGYWILANWRFFELTGAAVYRDVAVQCSHSLLASQREDGAWEYPNPEWRGRVATAEGTWGALGLLESFRLTGDQAFLDGALAWHRFLVTWIGFQRDGATAAVNYFAYRHGDRVLNNSAFVLRFLAMLAEMTRDAEFLRECPALIRFLRNAQQPNGELPYAVPGISMGDGRLHFQCFQYNAFQCLDLLSYYQLTGDPDARPIIAGLLEFLPTGVGHDGRAFYDCGNRFRSVIYHAAALAAALIQGAQLGFATDSQVAHRAYTYVLRAQRPDGGFPYSTGDYRVLSDRRSYPRYLAMILFHLLEGQVLAPVVRRETARAAVR